ncbi:MAG TPA: HAMP domain-containing sensor histidine kinase, partial [Prolixibacteraceae bacterium]
LHGVNIDITEKKRTEHELIKAKENAEASDRLKTAFMNNVSHEIRTPLNGILGFGQILSNPEFPAEQKEKYYQMLNDSSDRLLNTVNNFMDISLLTSGNQKIERKRTFLENLIDKVIEKFEEACQAKDLILMVKRPNPRNDYMAYTDGELLGKILHQLIDNAVKFTSHGHITVGLKKGDNEFIFFVKDSGIGISEENKLRIFGHFDQVDNADTRQYQGTGLGLPIAKGLTELLGGKIWLESEKGKGSTFYISIPATTQSQNQPQDLFEKNY